MIEYLNCDACTAVVSTEMTVCDYCGNDFRHSGTSAQLLKLRDDLDKKFFTLTIEEFLKFANSTKFRDHPIVQFRKSKIQLIDYMHNDGVLDAQEFCEILHTISNLKKISNDYWFEFALYISVIFPTPHTKLYLEDYSTIKCFLVSNNLDEDEIIGKKLKEQVLITDLGEQFFKEYNFYNDPKNYINNTNFIQKRDYLKEKYENAINKFNNQNK
jgi:hypothetical protein